jgi:hypothetical protein
MTDFEIARMSDADRVGEGMKRGIGKLGPAIQAQLAALVKPEALALAGGFFVAWLVSHAVGVGFVVDAIFLGVGVVSVGLSVFSGIDELIVFGHGAIGARTIAALDLAAVHFANAVSILGVQALISLLLRRAPQTFRNRPSVGPAPAPAAFRLKPGLRAVRNMEAGTGVTSWYGEITISRLGTSVDRRLAALHESFHRVLMPKLNVLRQVRADGRAASYHGSALLKYLEEAIAESYAQVSVHGIKELLTGITFPVDGAYVTLINRAVINNKAVFPVIPEAAGIFLGVANARGWLWQVYHSFRRPD